jgi:RNA polymerase sigma factor (sigma-70 family)
MNDQARDAIISQCLDQARNLAGSFARSSGLEAEDLLQNVALRLWTKWDMVVQATDPLAYAARLARNTMINDYHKAARRRKLAYLVSLDRPLRADSDRTLLDVLH